MSNVSLAVAERIWRREGLKVPRKQPRRRRLWLNDGSCIRLRPERPNHVWSYDFVEDVIDSGRKYRMLNIIDEFSRECLAMVAQRRFRSDDVLAVLADLFVERVPPEHIRSDNGPEFAAKAVRQWLARGRAPLSRRSLALTSTPIMGRKQERSRSLLDRRLTVEPGGIVECHFFP
ncbi:MAG: transposase [Alphaproteobacteria bacterium]|nr:transposase [Alphaproteobacteria bacterium]